MLHGINDCVPIDITLEKRCIKFICSLMNSKHTLYNSIVKYSFYNASTVIGENIRYFMSKYGIYEHEWYLPICTIYNKISKFVVEHFNIDNQCDAVAISYVSECEQCNCRSKLVSQLTNGQLNSKCDDTRRTLICTGLL